MTVWKTSLSKADTRDSEEAEPSCIRPKYTRPGREFAAIAWLKAEVVAVSHAFKLFVP